MSEDVILDPLRNEASLWKAEWQQITDTAAELQRQRDRMKEQRDVALQVASDSFREALTGKLAELAGVTVTKDMANFRIEDAIAARLEEQSRLYGIINVLCSDPSPFGSASFQKARDTMNAESRALLFKVLGG